MGYISSTDQKSLSERYLVTALVVVAMGLSALICLLIPKLVYVEPHISATINWTNVLSTAALLIGLSVVLIRRVLLSRVMLEGAARQGTQSLIGRIGMTSIICAALGEMVAVLSLVGYFVTGESFAWPVGVIALLLILYSFPRRGEWVRAVEAAEKIQ